jgi:hypothetical protein
MTAAANVTLSVAELQLLADAPLILTKVSALGKVEAFLGQLSATFLRTAAPLNQVVPMAMALGPKLSKGERHADLPWLMLDYPRCFHKQRGHLAFRTLFWWGQGFSMRLHASGSYLLPVQHFLQAHALADDWQTGLTDDPWQFLLPNPDWQPLNTATTAGQTLKMAKTFGIQYFHVLEPQMVAAFGMLVKVVNGAFRHQGGETDL